jgi:hypothetical protein
MARTRTSKSVKKEDDVSGVAGWLFTDLLLGLSFVFLAIAAPFVITSELQADENLAGAVVPCEPQDMTYYKTPYRRAYKDLSEALNIKEDIKLFALKEGIKDEEVAVALIQGPYESGERASDGQRRAYDFYKRLVEVDSENFPPVPGFAQKDTKESRVRFIGAPVGQGDPPVPRNGAFVELFFIYDPSTCD